jgi:hypothetical protein
LQSRGLWRRRRAWACGEGRCVERPFHFASDIFCRILAYGCGIFFRVRYSHNSNESYCFSTMPVFVA